jgi:hypothetical protein
VASGIGPFPILKRRLTMIMRGTRPRSLSAVGLLGLFGLGMAMLPWVPSWAQDPQPGGDRKEIVHELQQRTYAKPGEIEKAAQEVNKAAEELQRARAQFQEAEKRFMEAQRRLAQLGGGDGKLFLFDTGDGRTKVFIRGDFPPPPPPGGVRLEGAGAGVRAVGVRVDGAPADPKAAEEVATLTAQVKGKQALVQEAEARLLQTRARWARAQELFKRAAVTQEEVDVARGEVQIAEAQLLAKKAEVEEVSARLDGAKKRAAEFGHQTRGLQEDGRILLQRLQAPVAPPPIVTAPGAEGERRLQDVERKLVELLKEVQGLRKEMNPPATRPAPGAPPVPPLPPAPRNP